MPCHEEGICPLHRLYQNEKGFFSSGRELIFRTTSINARYSCFIRARGSRRSYFGSSRCPVTPNQSGIEKFLALHLGEHLFKNRPKLICRIKPKIPGTSARSRVSRFGRKLTDVSRHDSLIYKSQPPSLRSIHRAPPLVKGLISYGIYAFAPRRLASSTRLRNTFFSSPSQTRAKTISLVIVDFRSLAMGVCFRSNNGKSSMIKRKSLSSSP